MTVHEHVNDPTTCLEVSPGVCLTRTSDGYFVHFDPPNEGATTRQIGALRVGDGAWTQTGSFEAGDLTLAPSIRVSDPQRGELLHGWVRGGKWVPA